jgi:hypothetical protein
MCVICVLCLIVVPLAPGKNPFAVKINNNNNNNNEILTVPAYIAESDGKGLRQLGSLIRLQF